MDPISAVQAMKKTILGAVFLAITCTAYADQTGAIKICRRPGIVGSMDGKSISIPAGSDFTGACDESGEHCHEGILVTTTAAATIGPSKTSCAIVPATS